MGTIRILSEGYDLIEVEIAGASFVSFFVKPYATIIKK